MKGENQPDGGQAETDCPGGGCWYCHTYRLFFYVRTGLCRWCAGQSDCQKEPRKLVGDVTTWLMVLAPVVAGLLIIYFCIRRGMADEMDQKKWNNRIVVAVVSCIGAVLGSATLNLILGYYQ